MSQTINSSNFLHSLTDTKDSMEKRSNNTSENLDLQKNFLNLLIAQIKNQDPIDPIKNTELTSQLAQINTVGGIHQLNTTVDKFSSEIKKHQNIQMSELIGHHVMISYPHIQYSKKEESTFGIKLNQDADIIDINIKDKNGNIVYRNTLNNVKEGMYHLSWNGQDLNNGSVDEGTYDVSVTAKSNQINIPVNILSKVLVHSVITSFADDPIIDLGTVGTTTFSNIHEIFP